MTAGGGWQVPLRHANGAWQWSSIPVRQGAPMVASASHTLGVALLQNATAYAQRRSSVTPPSVTLPHRSPMRANGAGRHVLVALSGVALAGERQPTVAQIVRVIAGHVLAERRLARESARAQQSRHALGAGRRRAASANAAERDLPTRVVGADRDSARLRRVEPARASLVAIDVARVAPRHVARVEVSHQPGGCAASSVLAYGVLSRVEAVLTRHTSSPFHTSAPRPGPGALLRVPRRGTHAAGRSGPFV